ncbi:cupredoxin domain-containing protein [Chitinimonas sp.]|uniref:cupredoxin domain-containing protein n=1 Tax=Chitinimonas sp. TaxID=1934313 RepID=UPI0035B084EC
MPRLLAQFMFVGLFASHVFAAGLFTVKVVAKDGKLSPARLEVPAGQRIKIEISNQGKTPIEFENLQLRVEKVLAPEAESFVVLNPLRPGSYSFIDEFHPQAGKLELIAK